MAESQAKPKVVVVGSANIDLVVRAPHIPVVGETVLGGDLLMVPGGKGANQAVAAAKVGADAEVLFVAKLGTDSFGDQLYQSLHQQGVQTKYLYRVQQSPSGVALIVVDEQGNNSIVVAGGANRLLGPEDLEPVREDIASAGAVVTQLEIPLETVVAAAETAQACGVPFILDPAPARPLPDSLLSKVDVLTPNQTEVQMLTGCEVTDVDSARKAAALLLERGLKAVVLTMGAEGFLLARADQCRFVQACQVQAVDSTAAGDAFTGALAVGIAEGKDLADAAEFANYVAALSVTKMGAQPSMPTRRQVEEFVQSQKH